MFSLKILKYFKVYDPHLSQIVTPYNLRAHPLPVPHITHMHAESCLVYQLVKMKNSIIINDRLILKKNEDIHNDCIKPFCYTCGRT